LFDECDEKKEYSPDYDRVKVNSSHTYGYPYNCIGKISGLWNGEPVEGTGFLVSSCLVLTSAHTFCFFIGPEIVEMAPEHFTIVDIATSKTESIRIKKDNYRICPKYK
jgi:hypothetical protein